MGKKMGKESLTPIQLKETKELDALLKRISNIKDELKEFKLDNIYILETYETLNPKNVNVLTTHMGFPAKFKVVYISPEGIPYLRKITTTGNPTGDTYLPQGAILLRELQRGAKNIGSSYANNGYVDRFIPDPEELDSILLQQEFDPMAQHRDKSKLFNEINKHNKKVVVPTNHNDFQKIADFFKSRVAGDKFWTAPDKQFIIQSVVKAGREYCITATDINQKTQTFNFSYFNFRRLYSERPRSFAQESKI